MGTLDTVITPQGLIFTALFAVAISIVTTGFRRFVELLWPALSSKTPITVAQRFWEGLILPFLPAVLGALGAGFLAGYPFPALVLVSVSARVIYGLAVGWFSASIYEAVQFFVKKKWNIPAPGETITVATVETKVTQTSNPVPPTSGGTT